MVDIVLQQFIAYPTCLVALAWVQLATFWSSCFYMAMTFPKMPIFILTWSWHWGPPLEVEGLPSLAFFTTKPYTSFKCLVNNHFCNICDNASANFTFPFWPNLHPFFVLSNHIGWTRGWQWLRGLISFKFWI